MIGLIKSPFDDVFGKFAEDISSDCFICSPYVTSAPVKVLVQTIKEKKLENKIKINILTDISYRALIGGSTEISALLYLFRSCRNVFITYLPKVHAKVYIANPSSAIVTSANFTRGGERINFEYGVKINDSAIVGKIQKDMSEYKNLGAEVERDDLEVIHTQVEEAKNLIRNEQAAISKVIAEKQRRVIEDNLIRTRVKNKNINSIFSETLLYLLSKSPARTAELHEHIRNIHPDLCDDTTDRVIDGKTYGKLWKHQVRNAQQYLRRTGAIIRDQDTELWSKANH